MLQWMGGSRRKVTTSRKSTHKRDNSEDDDFSLNHQYAHPSLAVSTNEGIVDISEITEERIPSSYRTEAEYVKKVSNHVPDHNEDIVAHGNEQDPLQLSTIDQISVMDLLSDRENSNAENSVHGQEAHVAFSIEGLGKVEPKTPVHSPKIQDRSFRNGLSPPRKASRQPGTCKHLDYDFRNLDSQVDVMMRDTGFSLYDSPIEQPFCSRNVMNIAGYPYHNFRNSSCLNWNGNNSEGGFGDDELTYNIRDTGRNIWNGTKFSDVRNDDLGEYDSFCKNWVDQKDIVYEDYFHKRDLWEQDFNFDGWNLQKKSYIHKRSEYFDMTEPPVPCTKHPISKDVSDDVISEPRWYSGIGIDNDVKEAVNCFISEDARESLSLLSEESCSSTAVRGDTTKKS